MDLLTWSDIRESDRILDSPPRLKDLFNIVTPDYAAQWKVIGTLLDISTGHLNGIERSFPANAFWCCNRMLEIWLEIDTSASWKKLIQVIDSPAVMAAGVFSSTTATNIVHLVIPIAADAGAGLITSLSKRIKERYIQTRYLTPDDTEDIWQLLYPKHFVNMLLVHHLKQRSKKEISKVACMMLDGLSNYGDGSRNTNSLKKMLDSTDNELFYKTFETHKVSDIFDPIQKEDGTIVDPNLILIDGAPGMGKTTLCKQIAYGWAMESPLNNSLDFLLFLRDPAVQNIYSLKDLIHYFYDFEKSASLLAEQCTEMLLKRSDIDITIILDGYDEFCDNKGNLLVTKIGKRECLLHCKVVITSRPIASEKLQAISDVKVEVLGFTTESKLTFIKQELKSYPGKIEALLSFLNRHDAINSACYIPIMLTILVRTFKAYDELPNDESDLYEKFVSLTISRFLQKLETNPPAAVLSLQDLPQMYKDYLSNLCRFAFDAIETKRIVFTEKDGQDMCSKFVISFNSFHGLGLLNFTKLTDYSKSKINQQVSYSFVHLSIQEYLAAYYVKSLKTCDQFQLLKNNFFTDSYMNTWIMFMKMNKSITFEFQHMLCYSHVSGASSEDIRKLHTTVMNMNLFKDKDYFQIRSVNLDTINGKFKVILYKDNKHYFHQHKTTVSNYDTFWLFYQYDNLYVRSDCIKLYISLCSVNNSDSLLIEVYLVDKNTEETTYHNIVAELEHNYKLAVLLIELSHNRYVMV
ncbi:NACHT, LRR and PYD domains-containing protein 4A-like [Dysidea avara]|uniref:NACHT, LRR and PYD domains-containing protein 4A-like n=1 Tax=Dysidea avara TaxID=196820 RepID=UPI003318BEFD